MVRAEVNYTYLPGILQVSAYSGHTLDIRVLKRIIKRATNPDFHIDDTARRKTSLRVPKPTLASSMRECAHNATGALYARVQS